MGSGHIANWKKVEMQADNLQVTILVGVVDGEPITLELMKHLQAQLALFFSLDGHLIDPNIIEILYISDKTENCTEEEALERFGNYGTMVFSKHERKYRKLPEPRNVCFSI